ncbi:MAG TPA: cytochrome c3 family protein, partial [Burkholderiaceae bacterium]|nr:cytochrome c3 family protein [Burkholderiaceae bacterium]
MHASRFSPQRGAAVLWLLWVLLSAAGGTLLAAALLLDRANDSPWRAQVRKMFLPGATTHGHYQIELACETCHGDTFGGAAVLQDACVKCHGADLKEARDSHPKSKFTDPRNAERAAKLDATRCVTCHTEHRPQITHAAGLTLPNDYCVICHADIGKDRPTHKGLAFDTCASSGCHNFHDNRALYEDFLVKHAREPALLPKRVVAERDFVKLVEEFSSYPHDRFPLQPVNAPDAADKLRSTPQIAQDWLATAHAKAGVNCSGCHADQKRDPNRDPKGDGAWTEKPSHAACTSCHKDETKGFLAGRHGMRLAASLPAMQPAHARLPMKADAGHETLGCTSCHGAHRFDTKKAAVDACLGCHDDRHT